MIDATGAVGVLQHCLALVRSGGTLMIYGRAAEDADISISPYDVFRRKLTGKGSFS